MRAFSETIHVMSPVEGDADEFGDVTETWSTPVPVHDVTITRKGQEPSETGRRDKQIFTAELVAHRWLPVGEYDVVRFDGEDWDVDGSPERYRNPRTGKQSTRVNVFRVRG